MSSFDPNDTKLALANNELITYMNHTKMGIKEIVEKFSYKCEDIVTQFILFRMDIFPGCVKMAESIITPKGNCFSFVNNGNQTYPTLNGGIAFKLRLPTQTFYEVYPNEARSYDLGNDFSFTLEKNLGGEQSFRWITVAPYTRTEITLWTKLYKRTSNKVPCENDPAYYSSNTCFLRCDLGKVIEVCKCMPIDQWSNFYGRNVSACNPFNSNCNMTQNHYDEIHECQIKCKPMCLEWIFETSSSFSFDDNQDSTQSYVKIGYNTMQYTLVCNIV